MLSISQAPLAMSPAFEENVLEFQSTYNLQLPLHLPLLFQSLVYSLTYLEHCKSLKRRTREPGSHPLVKAWALGGKLNQSKKVM